MAKTIPSMDAWLAEAKKDESAAKVGMYLVHNGVVRRTARAKVRQGVEDAAPVTGMVFSYDREKAAKAIEAAKQAAGIVEEVKTWSAWKEAGFEVLHGSKALFGVDLIHGSKGDGQTYKARFFGQSQVQAVA